MPDGTDLPLADPGSDPAADLSRYASVLFDEFIAQAEEAGVRLGADLKATLAGIAADAERIAVSARSGRDVDLDLSTLKARVQNVSLLALLQFKSEVRDAMWRAALLAVRLAAAGLGAA